MKRNINKVIIVILISLSSLNSWGGQLVNTPFVIEDETYWVVLNDSLKLKEEVWNYDTPKPPPLLPNKVIKITRDKLLNQKIAGRKWKIKGVNLKQLTRTNVLGDGSTKNYAYSYYSVELIEDLRPQTPEWEQRIKSGNTVLFKIELIVKMNGEVVLPEKGKHLQDILPPELWEKYKLRNGIESAK